MISYLSRLAGGAFTVAALAYFPADAAPPLDVFGRSAPDQHPLLAPADLAGADIHDLPRDPAELLERSAREHGYFTSGVQQDLRGHPIPIPRRPIPRPLPGKNVIITDPSKPALRTESDISADGQWAAWLDCGADASCPAPWLILHNVATGEERRLSDTPLPFSLKIVGHQVLWEESRAVSGTDQITPPYQTFLEIYDLNTGEQSEMPRPTATGKGVTPLYTISGDTVVFTDGLHFDTTLPPDGNVLEFRPINAYPLVAYNLKTGKENQVAPETPFVGIGYGMRLQLAMNGRFISWSQETGFGIQPASDIHLYDQTTGTETILPTPQTSYADQPTWSGGLLVYAASIGDGLLSQNSTQIFAYNPADRSTLQLTTDLTQKMNPRRSDDGRWLFYTEVRPNPASDSVLYDVVAVDLSTGRRMALTQDGRSVFQGLATTPQGTRIFFTSKPSSDVFTNDLYYHDLPGSQR
jgi:hypothetical protein